MTGNVKYTVEQRIRLRNSHCLWAAHRLALIFCTCSSTYIIWTLSHLRKHTNCTTPLQQSHFPTQLCHAEKWQLRWNRATLPLQSSSLHPPTCW